MKANTSLLEPERFYHVYNRGINGEDIFREEKNYDFFLKKYAQYLEKVAHTYAYCLMKNHFHFLISVKSEPEIRQWFAQQREKSVDRIIAHQFSHLFNSYAQSFNKSYHRTGGLFETPFRRKLVESDAYFTRVMFYIHANPQKHLIVEDFRSYPHSSYLIYESEKPTKLKREEGLNWFGGRETFLLYHSNMQEIYAEHESFLIEFD
jgi:putative transposase